MPGAGTARTEMFLNDKTRRPQNARGGPTPARRLCRRVRPNGIVGAVRRSALIRDPTRRLTPWLAPPKCWFAGSAQPSTSIVDELTDPPRPGDSGPVESRRRTCEARVPQTPRLT